MGRDGDLVGTDFVDDVTVQTDGISRRRKYIDFFLLHHIRRHVVRDDRHVESHLVHDGRCEPRSLEIRASLRAKHPECLSARLAFTKHHAHNRLAEALGHDRAAIGQKIDEIICDAGHPPIAPVVKCDHFLTNRFIRRFSASHRSPACGDAQTDNLLHAESGRRPGGNHACSRLIDTAFLRLLILVSAFPGRERHAHAGGRKRPGALRHHICDSACDLFVTVAHHKFHFAGIDAPIQNGYGSLIVPGDVFVAEHKSQIAIRTVRSVSRAAAASNAGHQRSPSLGPGSDTARFRITHYRQPSS